MRHVMIVGGGQLGTALARRLVADGHEVTLLEISPERCEELRHTLVDVRIVTGDGTEAGDLEHQGIRGQDVLVAVTGADQINALCCALSRFSFGVTQTITRLVDPAHAWLLDPAIGVDVVLDQSDLLARFIAEELATSLLPEPEP